MPVKSETKIQHSSWLEIDLSRLTQNLEQMEKQADRGCGTIAVIKANAYGHGLKNIAKALDEKVTYLGISGLSEAMELAEAGLETPLFMFGKVFCEDLPFLIARKVTLSVSSFEEARNISETASDLQSEATIHIKVDTGMGRFGIPFRKALDAIERIAALDNLKCEGIYTHLPCAEKADGFTRKQIYDFSLILQALEKKGMTFTYRHAANSAGHLKMESSLFNLIRPGLTLYGLYPDDCLRDFVCLNPVLSLKSRILFLKRLVPGESVGYGRDFIASKPTTIATLPIGYSHGYPFRLSNKAQVLYQGKRCPIAGRVSMDYLCVDLGDTPAQEGDTITLLGEDENEAIHAEEMAKWAETIPYEIVTQLSPKLPRIYLP